MQVRRGLMCIAWLVHRNPVPDANTDLLWERACSRIGVTFNKDVVGQTAFEDICRTWTLEQAAAGGLPFLPDTVGRHWSHDAEIDVVAVNWSQHQILLGECKWGVDAVGRDVIESLVNVRAPRILAKLDGDGWQVHFVFFARAGFTDAARSHAATVSARLVDLAMIDADLSTVPVP